MKSLEIALDTFRDWVATFESVGSQSRPGEVLTGGKMRLEFEWGGKRNVVEVQAPTIRSLKGTLTFEPLSQSFSYVLNQRIALYTLNSACALLETFLPEQESAEALFKAFKFYIDHLKQTTYLQAYVWFEVSFLRSQGIALDFSECTVTGEKGIESLAYISPKSGKAVSEVVGEPYKEKLLKFPQFFKNGTEKCQKEDIYGALQLTGAFIKRYVLPSHDKGIPPSRDRLMALLNKR